MPTEWRLAAVFTGVVAAACAARRRAREQRIAPMTRGHANQSSVPHRHTLSQTARVCWLSRSTPSTGRSTRSPSAACDRRLHPHRPALPRTRRQRVSGAPVFSVQPLATCQWSERRHLLGTTGASARLPLEFGAVPRYRFKISWSVPTYRLDWIVLGYSRCRPLAPPMSADGRQWRHDPPMPFASTGSLS